MKTWQRNYLTVITETTEFNELEGTESLVYYVGLRKDINDWTEYYAHKYWSEDGAQSYANSLHRKYNTKDLVWNEA